MVLRGAAGTLRRGARAVSPARDLAMELWTTEPGLQFYDSAYLGSGAPGIDGQRHFQHAGLCLEPQRFPDSINRANFSPVVLNPGEEYRQVTEYRFSMPV
jgi:aldose 1-epimerase